MDVVPTDAMESRAVTYLRALRWRRFLAATATFGGVALASSDASASGYLTARFGTDHGTPASPNTFAVYFNPAALGGTKGTTLTGDISVLLRWAHYQRTEEGLSPSDPNSKQDPQYVAANTGHANLLNLLALPFVGVNTDFGTKNFRAGYAFYIPFGGLATWDRRSGVPGVPGSTDGIQRWHSISGQILAIYNTFAVAYKLPGNFSVGVNVSPVIHNVSTVRARNADGSDDSVSNGNLVEGRSLLEANGFNISAAAGVYWEPVPEKVQLGFSFTTRPGIAGDTKMTGDLSTQVAATAPNKKEVDFYQTYPEVFRLGGVFKLSEKWDLRSDVEYVRWSNFERQCVVPKGEKCNVASDGRDLSGGKVILNIPRNWNDAVGFRVGPGVQIDDHLELFGSAAVTTPAVPKQTIDAVTIDSLRLYGTLGAKYTFNRNFALAGSYNHIYFFNVKTNGENDQNISAHPPGSPTAGDYNASRSPSADGQYKSQIGFININAAYTF